jgi:hypothetical protein
MKHRNRKIVKFIRLRNKVVTAWAVPLRATRDYSILIRQNMTSKGDRLGAVYSKQNTDDSCGHSVLLSLGWLRLAGRLEGLVCMEMRLFATSSKNIGSASDCFGVILRLFVPIFNFTTGAHE